MHPLSKIRNFPKQYCKMIKKWKESHLICWQYIKISLLRSRRWFIQIFVRFKHIRVIIFRLTDACSLTCSFKFCPQNKDRTEDVFKNAVLLRKFGISPLTSIQKFGSALTRRNAWKLRGLSKWGHREQRNRPRVGHLYILNLCYSSWVDQDFNFQKHIFGKSRFTQWALKQFLFEEMRRIYWQWEIVKMGQVCFKWLMNINIYELWLLL
jgi:hypothetical protein